MPGIIAIILIDNPDPIIIKITIGTLFKLSTKKNCSIAAADRVAALCQFQTTHLVVKYNLCIKMY
jgi:hypothetical protein